MSHSRTPPPRPLTSTETLESLDQWKNQFITFYKRDKDCKQFIKPSFKWNSTREFYGLTTEDREDDAQELETLLFTVAGFLPFPYLTPQIVKDTKCWAEVWKIIYEHYGVKPNQSTFLDYVKLKKRSDERPIDFYHRMTYHARNHLAPAAAKVGSQVNTSSDTSVSYTHLTLPTKRIV